MSKHTQTPWYVDGVTGNDYPWLATGCRRVPDLPTLDEAEREPVPPEAEPYPGAEYLAAFMED